MVNVRDVIKLKFTSLMNGAYCNKCVFALIGPQSKLLVNISVETAQNELELLLFQTLILSNI